MFHLTACIVFVSAIVREVSAVAKLAYSAGVRWLDTVLTRTVRSMAYATKPVRPFAPMAVVLSAADIAPVAPTYVPADADCVRDRVQPHDAAAHNVQATAPATLVAIDGIVICSGSILPPLPELSAETVARVIARAAEVTREREAARKPARKSRAPRKGKVAAQTVVMEAPAFTPAARLYPDDVLATMNRAALQTAAKKHKCCKANATSDVIRAALALVLA